VLEVHPEERRKEASNIIAKMLAGKTKFCPVPLNSKDGQHIPVETRVQQGIWDGKNVLFGISKDISEIKESEEKFSKAFQSNAAAMAISTLEDGCFINVNDRFVDTFGYRKDEIIDKTSEELNIFADIKRRNTIVQEIIDKGYFRNIEFRVRTKSGETRIGLFSGDMVQLQDKKCLLTVMNDITERKRTEAEREKLISELKDALADVRTLSGLLPICASCKKIRDDNGYWNQIESYICDHSDVDFSHGICPECVR